MQRKKSFTAFNFDNVWKIDEETTPYLQTYFNAYELWLKDVGITYEPKPEDIVDGISAGVRYVLDINPSTGSVDLAEPLIYIRFDANGRPCVKLPLQVNTGGAEVTVLASEDLAVESSDVAGAAVTATKPLNATGRAEFPMGSAASRFYRLPATEIGGVQLWEGGPYWAECNVGTTSPEECGYYFWWGDTVGCTHNGSEWVSVKDGASIQFSSSGTAASTSGKDNAALLSEGWIDSTGNLVAAHDAATAHFGSPWRMPTDADFSALVSNYTTEWITTNGVSGRLVTGKDDYADRSTFLPAAGLGTASNLSSPGLFGFYWSSTSDPDSSSWALYLRFNSGAFFRDSLHRHTGRLVRPVRDAD